MLYQSTHPVTTISVLEVENLVLAKGFGDVAAKITNNTLNLMVYGEQLSQTEITKLQDIAVRTTGIKMENIIITPRM